MNEISVDTRFMRSEKLLYSQVDGDVTMMSVETGKYYSLTAVGARIWSLLDQPRSVRQVCDGLMAEYRVEPARCEGDVLNIFRRMAEEGVVAVAAQE
jgi:hypothetical protein